ncbi:MAG: DNA-directed RNA polymerase subunit omega [Deltaproteobacteria bacterium]|nr:MAG: DNA-directed RNA polymerase subunit omega [Deltaproteobacteria bacterium]
MARITVEDCLRKVDNRFGLIHLSAKRVRQLRKGAEPLIKCKNEDIVVSLREIAAGKVFQVREPGDEPKLPAPKTAGAEALPDAADAPAEKPQETDQDGHAGEAA